MQDLELRSRQQQAENPGNAIPLKLALEQLVQACQKAAILKRYQRDVSDTALEAEKHRLERSLQPSIGSSFKDILLNAENFKRLYILPIYVNRVIYYELFLNEPRFHEREFKEISNIRERLVKTPKARRPVLLKALTQELRASLLSLHIGSRGVTSLEGLKAKVKDNLQPLAPQFKKAFEMMGKKKDSDRLETHAVSPLLVFQTSFSVFIVKGADENGVFIDLLSIPKASFERWLEREIASIPVSCQHDLCRQVR